MASGGQPDDIESIRRRYRLIAVVGLIGDLVVIAALWLTRFLSQDLLVMMSALLLGGSAMTTYLLVKVLPDRIARERELVPTDPAGKE